MIIEQDFIYIQATEQQAKQLDAVWVKSRNAYKLPNTLGALRELHKLGYNVADYGKKKAEQRQKLLDIKTEQVFRVPPLRPYQQQDINFLMELPHAAIFNEQRTGEQI